MAFTATDELIRPSITFEESDHPEILLARKLRHHLPLSRTECDVLAKALSLDIRHVQRRTIMIEQGAIPTKLGIMLDGWACRYKTIGNGRRQVLAFYLPGDVCDFNILMAPQLDSTIELIDGARVAGLSRAALGLLSRNQPRITRGLWWESQAAASVQREWMVNIGLRNARERIAHLMCEIVTRLDAVGLVSELSCDLPLTQADLGDACAMTAAHTNRSLRELRDAGLAVWRGGRLTVHDWDGLAALADFDPAYLQLREFARDAGETAMAESNIHAFVMS